MASDRTGGGKGPYDGEFGGELEGVDSQGKSEEEETQRKAGAEQAQRSLEDDAAVFNDGGISPEKRARDAKARKALVKGFFRGVNRAGDWLG